MKKVMMLMIGICLLLGSCGTYEGTGAYTGAQFGHILGSAVGGIAGGWRGHEIGSIVGTVGGAAAGAAIGAAADRRQEERVERRMVARQRAQQEQRQAATSGYGNYGQGNGYDQSGYDQSGYDPQMRGDDRITFDNSSSDYPTDNGVSTTMPANRFYSGPSLSIRNAGIYEDARDGVLTRGESCKVIFEIVNNGDETAYNVFPLVEEATGNRHIHISPNLRIESIAPHQAVRYTAALTADRRLRNGQIQVRVGVALGDLVIKSQTRLFALPTRK